MYTNDTGFNRNDFVLTPTTEAALLYIEDLVPNTTYRCIGLFSQFFTPKISCVNFEDAYSFETLAKKTRSLEDIYENINSKEFLVNEDDYSRSTVREDDKFSCIRYHFKKYTRPDGSKFMTQACHINRFDPLTKIEHSFLK